MKKQLTKSGNRVISGVCGGIGEFFNVDPTLVRVIWVLFSMFFGAFFLGIFAYIICAVIIPDAPRVKRDDVVDHRS